MEMREYTYPEVLGACAAGEYPSCEIRAASGRLNPLLGVGRGAYKRMRELAALHGVGLILIGSRVSGPRSRQRTLHPALQVLPLATRKRAASAIDPGAEGVRIDKTLIKEYGRHDPRSSDLSVFLVDPVRPRSALTAVAVTLERSFNELGLSFPVRVFEDLDGVALRREEDFVAEGAKYLAALAPEAGFTLEQRREALGELYTTLNLPRPLLVAADWRNGALVAASFSASFSLGLGFHWCLPAVGFAFGLFGRYLARLRAGTARALGDGWAGNAAALALDAAIGASSMGLIVVPAASLPLGWGAIAAGSLTHTLAKGSLRLWLDKRFAAGALAGQSRGVAFTAALNFAQGALTSLVYAGSELAWALQLGVCAAGAALLFGPELARLLPAPPLPGGAGPAILSRS